MAYELEGPATLPASTGLRQYRFVALNSTSGRLRYPSNSTVGQPVLGVIVTEGTTGSTRDVSVGVEARRGHIVKVEAEASTLSAGNYCSASTVGRVQTSTNAGDSLVGLIVDGSSGGANRILSVMLLDIGSTVAPA